MQIPARIGNWNMVHDFTRDGDWEDDVRAAFEQILGLGDGTEV